MMYELMKKAISDENIDEIFALLDAGYEINQQNPENGFTALHYAFSYQRFFDTNLIIRE